MRRTVFLLALVLALGGCGTTETGGEPIRPARPAEPQRAELGWRESYPAAAGERLVFEVGMFAVTADGWSATVAVINRTPFRFEVDPGPADYGFGLMLFPTNDLKALEEANREGLLPAIREATTIEPRPPRFLQPRQTWRAMLSAPGSLAEGSWVRIVFGTFLGADDAPDAFKRVVWFTDRSHRL
ncbi:MAG TPA: hypothetical protein VNP89_09655 [Gaiellaceae bacterium]|nr:hypothetical protein [Gaiellaceae bacterium]